MPLKMPNTTDFPAAVMRRKRIRAGQTFTQVYGGDVLQESADLQMLSEEYLDVESQRSETMQSDELRAAAEREADAGIIRQLQDSAARIRRLRNGESPGDVYGTRDFKELLRLWDWDNEGMIAAGLRFMAGESLASQPDNAEPVTEEWMREHLDIRKYGGIFLAVSDRDLGRGNHRIGWYEHPTHEGWQVCVNGQVLDNATRGEIRSLCLMFGIPLRQ